MLHRQASAKRPYAPMSKEDLQYIGERRNRFKGLQGIRAMALHYNDQTKAAQCRSEAEAIRLELYRKYDIIL